MTNNCKQWLLPLTKEESPDQRFQESLSRILKEIGDDTFTSLKQFSIETSHLQKKAARAGLDFAIAIFNEASYLDNHCRHDPNNQYGWRSKLLRKQGQSILETIGFKRNNANKLVNTAEWLTQKSFINEEKQWLDSLTPSHLYELSRISDEGFRAVKHEISYPEFTFSAGQREISVRRLEELRRLYTKSVSIEPDVNLTEMTQQMPRLDPNAASDQDLLEQLIYLVKSIDWASLNKNPILYKLLNEEQETFSKLLNFCCRDLV